MKISSIDSKRLEKLVSTSSSKSGSKKARTKNREVEVKVAAAPGIPELAWRISIVVILVGAAVLRLHDLDLVPLHHDEGVNGNFLVRLVREGYYKYDPENYHGPTLYYFSAVIPWIAKLLFGAAARDKYGLTTFTIRLIPVIFGLATIGLVFLLRRRLGTVATLAAGLMLAVSPGAVYLSRYFIHETLFVFFTLGIVVALVRFYDDRNPTYLIPAGACFALLFATKETSIISVGVLIIALGLTIVYTWLTRKNSDKEETVSDYLNGVVREMGGSGNVLGNLALAFFVLAILYVIFYSSFFTNYQGIADSGRTFAVWSKTGSKDHVQAATMYLAWLGRQELSLLILGALGAAYVVLKPKNSLALFCALWSFGLIAAYSLIPYKTPWLVLNFIIPLSLISGYVVQVIYDSDDRQLRLVAVVMAVALGLATYQSIDLNFVNYDNDDTRYVYVYAHTTRGALELVDQVEQIAKERGGAQMGITIVSPDYWPLPWYFRNFDRVGYFGKMAASSEPIIIARDDQKSTMDEGFSALYREVPSKQPSGAYELRPGVKLLLYVRRPEAGPLVNPPTIRNP
jgi:uncharacterized protein (TIGR03663 family)